MAQVEPMDIDAIECDFDNKENTYHHSNVLPRTPCTEKGYEELDVSELNMKLRYSVTPASSPMSKSLTGCLDSKTFTQSEDVNNENGNLTRSLNSTFNRTENIKKSKVLPLQTVSTDPFVDCNRNASMLRLLEPDSNNITISVSTNDIDDNLSLPSTSSSVVVTPEATTPTKEIPKPEGSPILRGLKSVLSMFRSSQSPIPPAEDIVQKQDILSPTEPQVTTPSKDVPQAQSVLASTPVATIKQSDNNSSKRSSPLKESVVFNDGLERELQWKDESTIIFKQEKIPVHKLFFQNPLTPEEFKKTAVENLNNTVEYMDISCNESLAADKTIDNIEQNKDTFAVESDNEFLDCETTFTKNESDAPSNKNKELENEILESAVTVDLLENKEAGHPEPNIVNTTDMKSETVQSHEKVLDCSITNGTENPMTEIIADTKEEYMKSEIIESQDKESYHQLISKIGEKDFDIMDATEKLLKNESCSTTQEGNNFLLPTKDSSFVMENPSSVSDMHIQDLNATSAIIDSINNELNSVSIKSLIDDLSAIKGEESSDDIKINDVNTSEVPNKETVTKLEETLETIASIQDLQSSAVVLSKEEDNIKPLLFSDDKNTLTNYDDKNSASAVNATPSLSSNQGKTMHNFEDLEINADITICKDNSSFLENKTANGNINSNIFESNIMTVATHNTDEQKNITILESLPVVQYELKLDCKIENTIVEPKQIENMSKFDILDSNTAEKPDINNEENVLDVNMGVSDTEIHIGINKILDVSCNNMHSKSTTLDLDREIPELTVPNNMVTRKPPSEIPLPEDDDDIEQDNARNNSSTYVKNSTFEMSDLTVHAKDTIESATGIKESSHLNIIQNVVEHTEIPSKNISSKHIEMKGIDGNEINNAHETMNTCIDQDMDCDKILTDNMDMISSDNLLSVTNTQIKICELQNISNNNENISQPLELKENISVDVLKMQNTQNTCEKIDITMEKDIESIQSHIETVPSSFQCEKDRASELSFNLKDETNNASECSVEVFKNQVNNDVPEKGVEEIDEEIITSANNSPYVSVTDLVLDTNSVSQVTNEQIDDFEAAGTVLSPPASPKIVSKGYNFNFDEIDDPFATKTKIRLSPTPDSPNNTLNAPLEEKLKEPEEIPKKNTNNRRKSQPERKRPAQRKSSNASFSGKVSSKDKISETFKLKQTSTKSKDNRSDNVPTSSVTQNDCIKPESFVTTTVDAEKAFQNAITVVPDVAESESSKQKSLNQTPDCNEKSEFPVDEGIKSLEQTIVVSDLKSKSSSEQYFSLGTSSGESVTVLNQSKNVFNLPEIDDMNFNPFATKSKIRQSPPPSQNNIMQASFVSEEKDEKNLTKHIDQCDILFDKTVIKDSSQNTSSETCSSKSSTDRDATARIVLTEDEDTIEGPFLETDDLKDIEKFTEIDTEGDMMNFDDIPHEREENLENGELFIDADAFEFLLNQNKSTTVSDSGKESLFLKFDPLFAKRVSSDGVLAALSKVQKKQSTPKKITAPSQKEPTNRIEKSLAGPSNTRENYVPVEEYNEDLTSTMAKPMMVVNPAVSSLVSPRVNASTTPKINRRSLTFTSPAMAVIDRLLSFSGNSSHLNPDTSIPHINTHSETDLALTQLRELLAEKEIHVHNLRCEGKELKSRLAALEVQVRTLETESTERLTKINELNDRLSEKTKINKSMATVVEEYERTIASLIAEIEHDKKRNAEERMRLIKERDEQTAHLTSMEVSFSDLHSKYEKNKQIILSCKANEDMYKKSIKEFEENFSKMQTNYELLKQHATSKLNHANQEFEKLNRAHEAEVLKLNAMIKRKDLHITSLEETLAQKTKANEELTAICDELINKVG